MSAILFVTLACSVAVLLCVYIGGAVSRYDQPDLAYVAEPQQYWYPASIRALEASRWTLPCDAVMGQPVRELTGAGV